MEVRRARVVIVGGGTAGWMTAAGLAALIPPRLADIRLIESEEIGTVGVGEATLPHIRAFNSRIGLTEREVVRRTGATFKLGIEFRDWRRIGDSYIHPFGVFGREIGGVDFRHYLARAGRLAAFEDWSVPVLAARAGRFAPPGEDAADLASTYGYAYQFDATRYAPMLRDHAVARGVRRTEGSVVSAARDGESNGIAALTLASGEAVAADLFVDCSGFRSLLLGEAMAEAWESWAQWLPCDRAVALPSRSPDGPVEPFTRAVAMPAGWRWRIPLQHRVGNGYVFSSAHLDPDRAAERLVAALDGPALTEPRLLRFEAGRRRRNWVGNVVAVGLAGGFLEPLESTSIYLIQAAVTRLVELFPTGGRIDPVERDRFNAAIDLEYERIRDFLILHYHATERDDSSFWDHVRTMAVPDTLAERIALFRARGRVASYREGVFRDPSWMAVFLGQGIRPTGYDPRAAWGEDAALARLLDRLAAETAAAAGRLPDHRAYVEALAG